MAPANLEIVLPHGDHGNSYASPVKHINVDDDNHSESEASDAPDLNMPRVVDGEDWNHISKPGAHDVLLGRGGGT